MGFALRLSRRSRLIPPVIPPPPGGVSDISMRAVSSAPGNTASQVTIAKPSGTVATDVMYLAVGHHGGPSRTITPPAGWALVPSGTHYSGRPDEQAGKVQRIYRRVADGSEGSSFTFTASSSGSIEARCISLIGVDNTNPEDVVANGYYERFVSASGELRVPPVYVNSAKSWLVGFFLASGGGAGWTAPSQMTERIDTAPAGGSPMLNGMVATELRSAAGAVWTDYGRMYPGFGVSRTAVNVGGSTSDAVGAIVVVRPAGAGGLPAVPTPVGSVYNIAPAGHHVAIEQAIRSVPDGASASAKNTAKFPSGASYTQQSHIFVSRRNNLIIDLNNSTFTANWAVDEELRPNFQLYVCNDLQLTNSPGLKATPNLIGMFNPSQATLDTWLDASPGRRERTPQVRSAAYVGSLAPNEFQHGVGIAGGVNVTVNYVNVANIFGDGLACAPAGILSFDGRGAEVDVPTFTRFQFCKTTRCARHGISSQASLDTYIEDNIINDSWYWGIDNEIDSPEQHMTRHYVRRNTFNGQLFGAITYPAYGGIDNVSDIYIEDNIDNTGGDGADFAILFGFWDNDPATQRMDKIYVRNNTVRSNGANCIRFRDVLSGAVTGNSCIKGPNPAGSGPAILLDNSSSVVISPPANTMSAGFTALVGYI